MPRPTGKARREKRKCPPQAVKSRRRPTIPIQRLHNVFVHVPYGKIREHLSLIRKHLLNIEIFINADTLDTISPKDTEAVMSALDYGPSLTVHAPFMDLSPGAADSKVMSATIERFHQVFDAAATIRPKAIVFHSGYEKWKYDHKTDIWLEKSLKSWSELAGRAADIGTKIAIENIFEDDPGNLRQLMEALEALSVPHVGICFDTGHFNLFSKRPLGEWLDSLGRYIVELHLHDNMGDLDSHFSIGDGTFDFAGLFSALDNKDIIHTIEAHNPEDVLKSIDRLSRFLAQP